MVSSGNLPWTREEGGVCPLVRQVHRSLDALHQRGFGRKVRIPGIQLMGFQFGSRSHFLSLQYLSFSIDLRNATRINVHRERYGGMMRGLIAVAIL